MRPGTTLREDEVQELESVGFLAKQSVVKYARYASMSNWGFEAYVRLLRELPKSTPAAKVPA